jgi:hypothetical protein
MATRRRLAHNEDVRRKIQSSQLINRLQDHIVNNIDISPTQMKAIEILLRKSLPDLSSVEISGDVGLEVTKIERTIVDPKD